MLAAGHMRIVNFDLAIAGKLRALNLDDRVRPRWKRCPSHDARGFIARHSALRYLARHDFLDDGQCTAPVWQVTGADGIAIHHRLVKGRHVDIAGDVLGEKTTQRRYVQADHLGWRGRADLSTSAWASSTVSMRGF